MERIKRAILLVFFLLVLLLVFEVVVPAAKGATIGLLGVAWTMIKAFFLQDWMLSVVLFFAGSLAAYGTVHLSKRKETKMWSIATGFVSLISYISLYVRCSVGSQKARGDNNSFDRHLLATVYIVAKQLLFIMFITSFFNLNNANIKVEYNIFR